MTLAAFKDKGGISKADIDDAIEYLNKNETCFIHYVIKNNAIYTKGYGKYQVCHTFSKFVSYRQHRKHYEKNSTSGHRLVGVLHHRIRSFYRDMSAFCCTRISIYVQYSFGSLVAHEHSWLQGFKKFLDDMLHSLSRKVKLPDAEFLLNLGDWPQVRRHDDEGTSQPARPVFAWCVVTVVVDCGGELEGRIDRKQLLWVGERDIRKRHERMGLYKRSGWRISVEFYLYTTCIHEPPIEKLSPFVRAGAPAPSTGIWCCLRTK